MSRPLRELDVRYFAVCLSLLASWYSALRNPTPNLDAFTYLRTAEIFLQEGLAEAIAYYPWATYSVLIAGVHAITGMDLLNAAQLWNAVFFAIIVYVFITLIAEIDSSRRLGVIAAICVLLYPQLNEYRAEIIRDIAYLAFSLTALLQLIRLHDTRRLRHAFGFCLACLVAATFRPEAMLYLVLAPCSLLVNPDMQLRLRLRLFLRSQGITALFLLAALLLMGLLNLYPMQMFEQGLSAYQPFLDQARSMLSGGSEQLSRAIFNEHSAGISGQYITVFLITGLLAILLIKLVTGFGWVYLLVILYGLNRQLSSLPRHVLAAAASYVVIAISILFTFVFVTRFMTARYTMLFCMVLVLLVPVILERAGRRLNKGRQLRNFNRIVGVLALYLVVDSFISFGESKAYQHEAAMWVRQQLPPDAALLSNHRYVAYRSGRIAEYDRLTAELDPQSIALAPAGSWLVLELDEASAALMRQNLADESVSLKRYFPDDEQPRIGVYIRN